MGCTKGHWLGSNGLLFYMKNDSHWEQKGDRLERRLKQNERNEQKWKVAAYVGGQ